MSSQKKVAFIHPDLGIGGAQQLIVNLGLATIKGGYQPHIYTPYHHNSFPQTHNGTIKVHQHGHFFGLFPSSIFGLFKGILANIRCMICCLWMICYAAQLYQAVIVDQVSSVVPLLRLFRFKVIFYCHFPDKLLSGKRGPIKKIYRFFLDLVEEVSLLFAHKIYVNSFYTKDIFYQHFPILKMMKVEVEVLYPSIDFSAFDEEIGESEEIWALKEQLPQQYFFSLNRYERKKNINLAIQAFAELIHDKKNNKQKYHKVKLVIAGGYDPKQRENLQHLQELKDLTLNKGISNHVIFLTSISNQVRKYLLKHASAVLYTPQNQHFGIVPLQAMYLNIPVLAHNSGGPRQTVKQGCGYLCSSQPQQWAIKMKELLDNGKDFNQGRKQMMEKFGFEGFCRQFNAELDSYGGKGEAKKGV